MKSLIFTSILAFSGSALAQSTTTTAACNELEKQFPTKLVFPSEAQYKSTNENYFDIASVKKPACIFLPESAKDVSGALKVLRSKRTKFAVKSGGHMPGEFTNIDDGVLIATEKLNTLEWEGDDILKVGPGLRWGPVYDKAAEKGRIVIGGRLKQVGVAGLVIGGGISYTSGEYGFSCDNVKGFEVVLADGTITYASETQNKDLYKVLRGGTSNFGIVTRFDMDAYPLPLGWANIGFTDFNAVPGLDIKKQYLDAIGGYATKGSVQDVKTGIIAVITRVPSMNANIGMMSLWKSEPSDNATANPPEVFKPFLAIPGQHSPTNMPLNVLASTFGDAQSGGTGGNGDHPSIHAHNTFRTGSFVADTQLIHDIDKIHAEEFAAIADVPGLTGTLTFQPITPNNILVGARKRGGNVLGLESRVNAKSKPFMWTEQFASWLNDADTQRVQQAQKNIAQRAKALAQERGLWDPFVYLNDAATDQAAEVFPAYGLGNRLLMRLAKLKYDPSGVFTTLMPGGFKI